MRWLLLATVFVLAGCCGGIPGERVKEINAEWWRIYSVDRRQTMEEAKEYAALDAKGKEEWEKAKKPGEGAMSSRMLKSAEDYMKSIDAEAEAAK